MAAIATTMSSIAARDRLWIGSHHGILVILGVGAVQRVLSVVLGTFQRVLSALVAAVQRVQRRQRVRHFGGLDICVILGFHILQCFAADADQQSKEQERNLRLHFLQ